MKLDHNWRDHPVTNKRYQLLSELNSKGLLTKEWQSAIMLGAMDEYLVN